MLHINLCVFILCVASQSHPTAAADSQDAIVAVAAPDSILKPPLPDAPRSFHTDQDAQPEDSVMLHDAHDHDDVPHVESDESKANMTSHDEINALMAADEERVLSKGAVHTRKKRFFCKRCFPTMSYGYGGGGGCCGSCGGCGRSRRVQVVVRPIAVPVYGGGGYGGGGCCGGCNVCGRK